MPFTTSPIGKYVENYKGQNMTIKTLELWAQIKYGGEKQNLKATSPIFCVFFLLTSYSKQVLQKVLKKILPLVCLFTFSYFFNLPFLHLCVTVIIYNTYIHIESCCVNVFHTRLVMLYELRIQSKLTLPLIKCKCVFHTKALVPDDSKKGDALNSHATQHNIKIQKCLMQYTFASH